MPKKVENKGNNSRVLGLHPKHRQLVYSIGSVGGMGTGYIPDSDSSRFFFSDSELESTLGTRT